MQKDAHGLSIDLDIKSALCRGKQRALGVEIVDDLIFIISRSIFSGLAGKFYYSVIIFVLLLISNMQIACQLWLKLCKRLINIDFYCFRMF